MTTQHTPDLPLALDLANWLEEVSTDPSANQAAAELRRLHAESERLAALEAALAAPAVEPVDIDQIASEFGFAGRTPAPHPPHAPAAALPGADGGRVAGIMSP